MNSKKKSMESIMFTSFGILAPAPIITFFSITAYVWFLMLTSLYLLFSKKMRLKKCKYTILYISLFVVSIISMTVCAIRMPDIWKAGVHTRVIQTAAVLVIFFYINSSRSTCIPLFFLKGIYISAVMQMLWGYLQLISSFGRFDLNTFVFGNLLKMYSGTATQFIDAWNIKISGWCWNSGNYAPLMIIGYLFSNRKLFKYSFLIISLVSGSRTLMISIVFCVAIEFAVRRLKNRKISKKSCLSVLGIIILAMIVLFLKYDTIIKAVQKIIVSVNVFANYHTEGSTHTHIWYLLKIPEITLRNDLITNLIGFGPGCSGYAYFKHFNFYSELGRWVVESDYIDKLWNIGYIGFIIYYMWYFFAIKKSVRLNKKYMVLYGTFLISGFMYNITFNWVDLTNIMIFGLVFKGVDLFGIDILRRHIIRSHIEFVRGIEQPLA